ncbi:MAG TPA: hypothetical protein VFP54_05430 [Acidimicrobiales bacterium]|nr:hypothetical protein [Acidimicrobiales bacterium]
MHVRLIVHLERVPDQPEEFVWWAETDQVPGFSAAAGHLPTLLERAKAALTEFIGDEPELAYELAAARTPEHEGARLVDGSYRHAGRSPRVIIAAA